MMTLDTIFLRELPKAGEYWEFVDGRKCKIINVINSIELDDIYVILQIPHIDDTKHFILTLKLSEFMAESDYREDTKIKQKYCFEKIEDKN